jgi:hypothetical protein
MTTLQQFELGEFGIQWWKIFINLSIQLYTSLQNPQNPQCQIPLCDIYGQGWKIH